MLPLFGGTAPTLSECAERKVLCAEDLEANEFWGGVGYRDLSPAVPATHWVVGRPRIYATNAERQRAYRARARFVTEGLGYIS